MKNRQNQLGAIVLMLTGLCLPIFAEHAVTKTLPTGGDGKWDYVTVDSANKLLYISRSTHMIVVKQETGAIVADIKDTPGVHGVALAPELNRGFTSNGRGNNVTVFDLKTNAVLGTVPTGDNPDAIAYDPATKKIFTFNGKSKNATVIDATAAPAAAAAVKTIPLAGKPEFFAFDGEGHLYINIEDTSSVQVIDTKTLAVINTWKIEGGEEPSGMAIDTAHHLLFLGCGGNNVMAIMDYQTGKTISTYPIGKGVDACAFDPKTGEVFATCGGDGVLTIAKANALGKFEVTETVKTYKGAKTMGFDPQTHTIFAPAMTPAKEGTKATSFVILVVTKTGK